MIEIRRHSRCHFKNSDFFQNDKHLRTKYPLQCMGGGAGGIWGWEMRWKHDAHVWDHIAHVLPITWLETY